MTHQVLRGPGARAAIEIMRDAGDVIIARIADDCSVELINHPLAWMERGAQFKDGRRELFFDEEFRPLLKLGKPYPLHEAVRNIIKGRFSPPSGFKGGALEALAGLLPAGEIHVFAREGEFIGRYSSVEDAEMVAKAIGARRPILFGSPEEFASLVHVDQQTVFSIMDTEREWPAEVSSEFAIEVFELAKLQVKRKASKIIKSETRAATAQRRADGPVAQARAIFDSMRDETDREKIMAACAEKGINPATAATQLGRWRKDNGITVKRISKKNTAPKEGYPTKDNPIDDSPEIKDARKKYKQTKKSKTKQGKTKTKAKSKK